MILAPLAFATNWEGHETFFHEVVPLPELTEGIEHPISKPLPLCADIREKRKQNPYEQEAIPGRNCIEKQRVISPQSE